MTPPPRGWAPTPHPQPENVPTARTSRWTAVRVVVGCCLCVGMFVAVMAGVTHGPLRTTAVVVLDAAGFALMAPPTWYRSR